METKRQPPACHNDQNLEGVSSTCRGRGRGRGRAHLFHDATHMSSPGYSYQSPSQNSSKNMRYSNKAPYMQHDDRCLEKTRSSDYTKNSPNRVANRTYERHNKENANMRNSEKSHDRQDKENSNSPRTQRSHRAHFDVGMMSRINKHLQGINERSDSSANRSVRRKESSPPSDSSGRASPDHIFGSPSSSTSSKQFASSIHTAVAEEQTSDLTPHSPATLLQDEASAACAALHAVALSTEHQGFHSQSPVSQSKAKGRGRARGRARSRQESSAPSPGEATTTNHIELSVSEDSHPEDLDGERFADATENATQPESNSEADVYIPEATQSSLLSADHVAQSVAEKMENTSLISQDSEMVPSDRDTLLASEGYGVTSLASADSGAVSNSSDMEEEHVEKSSRSPKGLSLEINVKETNVAVEDLRSPDDITQLLSPNHVYILDWAAAMESPENADETPPVWNS